MTLRYAHESFLTLSDVRGDLRCGCVTDTYPDDTLLQSIIDSVSDDIAIVSGHRVAGRQSVIARPCYDGADRDCCPCCGLDAIPLGDQRVVVSDIKIDGVSLAANEWWSHWNGTFMMVSRLPTGTETTPSRWPTTQDRWRDDTEDDTFAIYFTQGTDVDTWTIREAALEAVCDRVAQAGKRSEGLQGVTSITLGGATATIDEERLHRIRTGALGPATEHMLSVMAPEGRTNSAVWAPELALGWSLNLSINPSP